MSLFGARSAKLDKLEAAKILENIFEECEKEPNSVPMEELESYSNYRKESFQIQMIILIGALICFIFLPLMFVSPNFDVTFNTSGERGLPVYEIDISTALPVKKVVAKMNGYRLPVYEVDGHKFTIEPTSNGEVDLTVELINGQWKSRKLAVLEVDSESPRLVDIKKMPDSCSIYVEDDISGIDFESIYAVTKSGKTIYPSDYYRKLGCVVFSTNIDGATVYILDNFKNMLQLKI